MKIRMMVAAIALSSALGVSAMEDELDKGSQLVVAAAEGKKQKVIDLLNEGVAIESKRKSESWMKKESLVGKTALQAAVDYDQDEVVKFLVECGANVNIGDPQSRSTPLFTLVFSGKYEMVEFLLAHGADVDARNIVGQTPLFQCNGEEGVRIVPLLKSHGAEVNATSGDGTTCLKFCSYTVGLALKNAGATE